VVPAAPPQPSSRDTQEPRGRPQVLNRAAPEARPRANDVEEAASVSQRARGAGPYRSLPPQPRPRA
jgi:hypothetical protein